MRAVAPTISLARPPLPCLQPLFLLLALTGLVALVSASPPQGGPDTDPHLAKDIELGSYAGREHAHLA